MYACRKTVCTNLKIHVHGKMVNAIPSLPFGFGFRLKHSSLSVSIRVAFLFCCVPMALVFCPFDLINPRRACAVRVTVVVLCVCVVCLCVQAAHLRLTQLSDKLDILTDLVSCWLQNEFGVFRIMASFRR